VRRWNFSKTEAVLWLLFLFACVGFGYFQGVRPDFKVSEYILPPTSVKILTISESFFPPEVISELESETHTHIQVVSIKDWSRLQLQLIASPSPEILFIPSHWTHTLQQQGLLREESPLQKKFSKYLATDFAFPEDSSVEDGDFFPIYWAKLSLYAHGSRNKTLAFLDDADLWWAYQDFLLKNNSDLTDFNYSVFSFSRWFNDEVFQEDLFLSTHVLAQAHPEWRKSDYPSAMFLVGFALPKNSQHLGKTLKIINHYVSFETQKHLLERFPFASTLKIMEESHLIAEKKSSFLRSLEVSQLILPKQKDAEAEAKAKKATQATFSL
jgi:hypothetical protein